VRNFQIGNNWWKLCAAVLLLSAALWPGHLEALPPTTCSSTVLSTSTMYGTGSTCTAAQSNLSSMTLDAANARCISLGYAGVCGTGSLNYVSACTYEASSGGYYYRGGYRTFTCKECSVSNPCLN